MRFAVRFTWRASVAFTIALACSSGRGPAPGARFTPDELLSGASLDVHSGPAVERDVLAVTPEMQRFIDANVEKRSLGSVKLRQLVGAIIDSKTFGVEYDDTTRTAAETFTMRRGNCLSFSNLFVAMARTIDLDVAFQEVDVPPDWTLDQDTYVLNQHVNVYVNLGPEGTRVVDFNIGDFKTSYEMERISDARALAHYYNNVGVARMQEGDAAAALACFRNALARDLHFSPGWTNLGTLYLRSGDRVRAEAAYLRAIEVNERDLVPMSNLARLYDLIGDRQRAAEYQKKVIHHRRMNPYYRYELARRAFLASQYDGAISHLRYAIRKRPKEDRFYFLLGLAHLKKGNDRTARFWLDKAQKVAATDTLKRRYSNKIDILLKESDEP